MATISAGSDEVQILVYNYYATLNTTGTDNVTVNVSNLPATLAGKELFVTHFRVDETHSNPYRVWTSQSSPTNPTEAQWQAMKPGAAPGAARAGQQDDGHHLVHDDLRAAQAGGRR